MESEFEDKVATQVKNDVPAGVDEIAAQFVVLYQRVGLAFCLRVLVWRLLDDSSRIELLNKLLGVNRVILQFFFFEWVCEDVEDILVEKFQK